MRPGRDDRPLAEMDVAGEFVAAVVEGVEKFSADAREPAQRAFRDRDLATARPGEWYPLSSYVHAVEAVHGLVGDHAVHALGQRIARAVAFPEGVESVPDALDALDDVCRDRHRGGDVGGYAFRQIGDEDGRIECHTPTPVRSTGASSRALPSRTPTGSSASARWAPAGPRAPTAAPTT
ncbi:hypothetical protein ACFQL4_23160 [Halosimplex aquaticum]